LFAFVVLGFAFFSIGGLTTPSDWLGRTSSKLPIF